MNRGTALALAAAAAIAIAGALALRDWFPSTPRGAQPPASGVGEPSAPDATEAQPRQPSPGGAGVAPSDALGERPASLRGTRVDGALVTDANGRFVPTPDARRLFDYFLAASGEEPEAVTVARIRVEIDRRLTPEAARDAHVLLDRYLAYRGRTRELAERGLGDADLAERLDTLRALRRETLGEEAADAFFAEEEAVDQAAIEKQAVAESDLPAAERDSRIAEIEASLPAEERARRRSARLAIDLRKQESDLIADGGTPEDVRALREREVGAEAAERLAALDAARADWRQRVDAYRDALAQIENDTSLDANARVRAIENLRAEHFSETERLRIDALDEIERP